LVGRLTAHTGLPPYWRPAAFATVSVVSIPETVLIFVGAPALIIAVISLAAVGPSELRKQPSRYRPGRPWPHEPAWFVPHPAALAESTHGAPPAIGGHAPAQLASGTGTVGAAAAIASTAGPKSAAVGGATREW
jgi:hypothetical protein